MNSFFKKYKIKALIFLSIFNFLSCQPQTTFNNGKTNEYHFKFGGIEDRLITVEAIIPVNGDQLNMISRPQRFIPDINSWWDIITIEEIEDEQGNSIKIIDISNDKAKLNQRIEGSLKIKYTIDISYIDKNYPNLNTAIGKSFKEGVFIVGKPLFIFGDWELPVKVQISKPDGVKITVPWETKDSVYSDINLRNLMLSNIIISTDTIGVVDFSIDKFSYSLATFALEDKSIDLVKQTAKDISNYYVKTFPFNHDIRYVQLVYGVSGVNGGGEAYPNSSASAISKNNMKNSFLWKITVFHELFHMWNSHMLNGVAGSADMEWFQEGFTDYMTELALLKTGHIDAPTLSDFQNQSLKLLKRRLENNTENITIKNSGSDKGKNYVIVYRGGWLIANWLDKRLKEMTNDKWDIERLFQQLFIKYPPNGEFILNVDNLLKDISIINEGISQDLKSILNSTNWSTINNYINQ